MDAKKFQNIILEAGKDEKMRQRLLQDPRGALKDADFEIPEEVDIKVHENGPNTIHTVLPIQQEGVLEAWKKFNPYGAMLIEKAWERATP